MEPDLEYLAGRAIGAVDAVAELMSMADTTATMRLHDLAPLMALVSEAVRQAMPDHAPKPPPPRRGAANDIARH